MSTQRGHSLIELMVAIALGLMLASGLLVLYSSAATSAQTNERLVDVQTNGRFAINALKADLRSAGFKGFASAALHEPSTTLPAIGNECLQAGAMAGSFAANMGQAIWASQDSNPFSANCIPASHYARGDVVVIRKVSPLPTAGLSAKQLYLRSNYSASEVFGGTTGAPCPAPVSAYKPPFNQAPCLRGNPDVDLQDFKIDIHVYFIRNYTVSANESPRIPALCRIILRSDGVMTEELVASGIEDLRLQYARMLADGNTQYLEANAIQGSASATASTEWDDVHAARVWLLARSTTAEPGYTNQTVYAMSSSSFPRNPASSHGDGYRRQLFSTVVQLRNR